MAILSFLIPVRVFFRFFFMWDFFKVFIEFGPKLLWFFGYKACGILTPWPGIELALPALESEVLTTGPPGSLYKSFFLSLLWVKKRRQRRKSLIFMLDLLLCVRACSVTSVMNDSLWPYGLYPSRLLCPRDFAGKNTRVGCHALL